MLASPTLQQNLTRRWCWCGCGCGCGCGCWCCVLLWQVDAFEKLTNSSVPPPARPPCFPPPYARLRACAPARLHARVPCNQASHWSSDVDGAVFTNTRAQPRASLDTGPWAKPAPLWLLFHQLPTRTPRTTDLCARIHGQPAPNAQACVGWDAGTQGSIQQAIQQGLEMCTSVSANCAPMFTTTFARERR